MFQSLVNRIKIGVDERPPEGTHLPTTLWAFVWYFVGQKKAMFAALFVLGLIEAGFLSSVFWYIGHLVTLEAYETKAFLLGLGLLLGFKLSGSLLHWILDKLYTPYFGNMIRRQLVHFTTQQNITFFQNDFAGRIANKIMQAAPCLRDAVKEMVGGAWFAAVFNITNMLLLANVSWEMAVPFAVWLVFYVTTLAYFVPKIKQRSLVHSRNQSMLSGQIVDTFTNFVAATFFARRQEEDARAIRYLNKHSTSFEAATMTIWTMKQIINVWNVLLIGSVIYIGLQSLDGTAASTAALVMALPMALQAMFQSGWIMFVVTGIFENLGAVEEGMETLAKVPTVTDKPNAPRLQVTSETATIAYEAVQFAYGEGKNGQQVLDRFSLTIPAGQKVGLIGRSGAGKSTVINLGVRAYDVEGGAIRINGQNIADVTQDSLREAITMVAQESDLFHRSVRENICYGNPTATQAQVEEAAKAANAHDFILKLKDNHGNTGYDALVGERGVKLSGGQRQRIAIARALLKDAPILILDEATSALDSESEAAIQEALQTTMAGKTVMAIAHRLSTLQIMDRLIVMDAGTIVEDGTHDELLAKGGIYAGLWQRQTGGYLPE